MSALVDRALARLGGRARSGPGESLLRRRAVGYAAFAIVVFAVALLESLPHDLLVHRALDDAVSGTPLRVDFAELRYGFPNRYRLRRLELAPRDRSDRRLEIERLDLRVPLLALLLGRRLVSFAGAIGGGEVDGWLALSGGETRLSLHGDDLRLHALAAPFLPAGARLGGSGRLDLDLAADPNRPAGAEGHARFQVRGIEAIGLSLRGMTLPALSLSRIVGTLELHGTRLQVEELRAEADGVRIGLSGDVLLRRPAERSVLSLGLRAEVSPDADATWRLAQAALLPPRPTGARASYSLRGTIARPVVR